MRIVFHELNAKYLCRSFKERYSYFLAVLDLFLDKEGVHWRNFFSAEFTDYLLIHLLCTIICLDFLYNSQGKQKFKKWQTRDRNNY